MSISKGKAFAAGAIAVGAAAGAYAGKKIADQIAWFKNYSKLVDYKLADLGQTELKDDEGIKLVAHRGYRAAAPENTLPAYEKAGEAGYWGCECDIYMTIDGVWICHHDPMTTRMMDKTRVLEASTYKQLLKLKYTNGHHIDEYPDLHICTFEEYVQVCAKYNMHAVIEIKYNRNLKHYDKLIDIIKKYGVDATFIAFSFEDLVRLRELCDNDLYYLVDDIKDEQIERAKTLENCGISYDGNHEANVANDGEMIKKCHSEGLKTATWAVDDLERIQQLYSYGTQYITTNSVTYTEIK